MKELCFSGGYGRVAMPRRIGDEPIMTAVKSRPLDPSQFSALGIRPDKLRLALLNVVILNELYELTCLDF